MKKGHILVAILVLVLASVGFVAMNRDKLRPAYKYQESFDAPSAYTKYYSDDSYGFSFSYPGNFELSDGCGYDSKDILKQIALNSTDSMDRYINPIACIYVTDAKEKATDGTAVKLGSTDATLYSYGIAGGDFYKYKMALKNDTHLYFSTDEGYITKQSLTFEDDPVIYPHFLKLSDDIQAILNSLTIDK